MTESNRRQNHTPRRVPDCGESRFVDAHERSAAAGTPPDAASPERSLFSRLLRVVLRGNERFVRELERAAQLSRRANELADDEEEDVLDRR